MTGSLKQDMRGDENKPGKKRPTTYLDSDSVASGAHHGNKSYWVIIKNKNGAILLVTIATVENLKPAIDQSNCRISLL